MKKSFRIWFGKRFDNEDVSSRLLPLIVLISSLAVLVGWVFNIPFLMGNLDGRVSIKIVTVMYFTVASIILLADGLGYTKLKWVAWAWYLLWLIIPVIIPNFFGFVNVMFVDSGVNSLAPQVPSWATIAGFWLIALAIIAENRRLGLAVLAIAIMAIVGYIAEIPALYYLSPISTAMAVPTALLFIGLAATLISQKEKKVL